jgi:hypothetical protein
MSKPPGRKSIKTHGFDSVGSFAVMRHTTRQTQCKFSSLHETRASAFGEAERLAAGCVEQYGGEGEFCFYVVEIVGRVGIIDGRLQTGK